MPRRSPRHRMLRHRAALQSLHSRRHGGSRPGSRRSRGSPLPSPAAVGSAAWSRQLGRGSQGQQVLQRPHPSASAQQAPSPVGKSALRHHHLPPRQRLSLRLPRDLHSSPGRSPSGQPSLRQPARPTSGGKPPSPLPSRGARAARSPGAQQPRPLPPRPPSSSKAARRSLPEQNRLRGRRTAPRLAWRRPRCALWCSRQRSRAPCRPAASRICRCVGDGGEPPTSGSERNRAMVSSFPLEGGARACGWEDRLFWCFRGPPSCRCLPGAQLPHPAVAPAPEPGGPGRLPVPIPTPAHAHPPPSPAGGGPPAEAVCGAQDGWRAAHARQLHLPALQWPQIPLGCWHHGGSPAQVQPGEVRRCTPRGLAAVGLGGMAFVCGGGVIVVGGRMLCVGGLAGMLGVRSTCTHTPNSHAAPFSLPTHLLPARPPRPPTHQPLALTSPSRPRPATALQLCTLRQQQCSSPAPTPLRALRARRWAPRRWRCWRSGWARWRGCALRTSCGQVSLGADVIQGGLSSLGQRLCAAQGPRGGGPGSDCAEGGCVHNLLKEII